MIIVLITNLKNMNQILNLLSATLVAILIITSYWYIAQNKVFKDNVVVSWIPMNVSWDYVVKWYDTKNIIEIIQKIRYVKNDNIIYVTNINPIYENKQLKDMDLADIKNVFNSEHIYSYMWVDWKRYHNLLKK